MIIPVISDTHDLLRLDALDHLQGCDCILHGGDISSRKILEQLEEIAPVRVVRGNNDKEWTEGIPLILDIELSGLRICMAHKKKVFEGYSTKEREYLFIYESFITCYPQKSFRSIIFHYWNYL